MVMEIFNLFVDYFNNQRLMKIVFVMISVILWLFCCFKLKCKFMCKDIVLGFN